MTKLPSLSFKPPKYVRTPIFLYLFLSLLLHLLLSLLHRAGRPVPLGPVPAFHSLLMTLLYFTIFAGNTLSSAAEIRETKWIWRRSKTPFQWICCRRSETKWIWRRSSFHNLFKSSPSFQPRWCTPLCTPTASVWPSGCLGRASRWVNCQMLLLGCNVACHVWVLLMHFLKGSCNRIGAWGFNFVLNAVILLLFLNFYVKIHWGYGRRVALAAVEAEEGVVGVNKDKEI